MVERSKTKGEVILKKQSIQGSQIFVFSQVEIGCKQWTYQINLKG